MNFVCVAFFLKTFPVVFRCLFFGLEVLELASFGIAWLSPFDLLWIGKYRIGRVQRGIHSFISLINCLMAWSFVSRKSKKHGRTQQM